MSCFERARSVQPGPDTAKRVKYTNGQMLTARDFKQEQTYLMARDQRHNRELHGYGTVCGLDVSVRDAGAGFEVWVTPGVAINPMGQEIRVGWAQRLTGARLNDWIGRHRRELEEGGERPPRLSLYVILCYAEREAGGAPAVGGPDGGGEDTIAPSRIADGFDLCLSVNAPDQGEEEAVRRLGELLARVEIAEAPGEFVTATRMEDLVRGLAQGAERRRERGSLRIRVEEAGEVLRAALRVWVTQVRPAVVAGGSGCASAPDEGCVLLARLGVPVDDSWEVTGDPEVDQDERPVLLPTRVLQEWMENAVLVEVLRVG